MSNIDQLASRLKDAQEFCDSVNNYLENNFIIEGKTMVDWKRYFYIKIPDDINFVTLAKIPQDIAVKFQEAARYRDSQQVSLAVLEQNKSDKYHTEFQSARLQHQDKFGKPLAAESCKVAATLAIKDLEAAINHQEVIHTFWVKTCNTLTEMRKLIETIGFALSGDARVNQNFNIKTNEH